VAALTIRPASECNFDEVSLGEVMLRFDPGEGRTRTARSFHVYEGGGEYNVARGLRRAFGMRTAIVTALVDNEVGRLVEDLMLTGGVDTSLVSWFPHDGVGRAARNGLNFTERGFGVRAAVGVSDRGHTAASQLAPDDIDWDDLFGRRGVRWFHTGGIYAALSETSARTTLAAAAAARRHGAVVSYDLNYRPSLWKAIGGKDRAQEVNRAIAPHVDVMFGNEEDFAAALGFSTGDDDLDSLDVGGYAQMIGEVARAYPNLAVIATTLRTVRSAGINDWGALAWSADTGVLPATQRDGLEILDRVGGGDSFASGLAFGLLDDQPLALALEYGAAHGALAMTTPGDTSMVSKADVVNLAAGSNARVIR
jgi:2-dehydro-3-deoxygluconokinase